MKVLFHGSGQYPDGTPIGPRCWPHHDLLVVSKGRIVLKLSGKLHVLEEGDAILIPPHLHFAGEGCSSDAAIWVLHFKDIKTSARLQIFHNRAIGAFASAMMAEIAKVWRAQPRPRIYLETLVCTLLARLKVPESHPITTREKRRKLVSDSGSVPKRVAELAQQAGICGSHYRALFRVAFGETPRAHLRNTRINKARELLSETRMPIKDIATRVGYGEAVAFHRAFTAIVGSTPARYRKSATPAA